MKGCLRLIAPQLKSLHSNSNRLVYFFNTFLLEDSGRTAGRIDLIRFYRTPEAEVAAVHTFSLTWLRIDSKQRSDCQMMSFTCSD